MMKKLANGRTGNFGHVILIGMYCSDDFQTYYRLY